MDLRDLYKSLMRWTGDTTKKTPGLPFSSQFKGLTNANTLLGYSPTPQGTSYYNLTFSAKRPLIGYATDFDTCAKTWRKPLLAR